MKQFRLILAGLMAVLMVIALFYVDFSDLSWETNKSSYLLLASGTCTLVLVILSNREEKREDMRK